LPFQHVQVSKITISQDKPETIRVRVPSARPGFSLRIYKNGVFYYLRDFGNFDAININLKNPGEYIFSAPVEILSRAPLVINCPISFSDLPEFERNYPLPDQWEKDVEIGRTPGRMFAKHGLIQTGERFNSFPLEWRIYVLLHEIAHAKYKTEWKADTLALYWFCLLGYNHSQALYALSKVLHQSPANMKRIKNIYKFVKP